MINEEKILQEINNEIQDDAYEMYLPMIEEWQSRAKELVEKADDEAITELIDKGIGSNTNITRQISAYSLAKIGKDAIPALLDVFGNYNYFGMTYFAQWAAYALGYIGDKSTLPFLKQQLSNESSKFAIKAINFAISAIEEEARKNL